MSDWANNYVGIEFADNGRERTTGLDCWGLVRLIQREQFNRELPSWAEGYNIDSLETLIKTIDNEAKFWVEVAAGLQDVGDVLILQVFGKPCHVGMVVGPNKMIHTHRGHNSVIEKLNSIRWRNRIAKIYRYDPTAEEKR